MSKPRAAPLSELGRHTTDRRGQPLNKSSALSLQTTIPLKWDHQFYDPQPLVHVPAPAALLNYHFIAARLPTAHHRRILRLQGLCAPHEYHLLPLPLRALPVIWPHSSRTTSPPVCDELSWVLTSSGGARIDAHSEITALHISVRQHVVAITVPLLCWLQTVLTASRCPTAAILAATTARP